MYKEHHLFVPPPHDAALWRYVDFTKFVSLLDRRALFFPRADKLGDPFEGSLSRVNAAVHPVMYTTEWERKGKQETLNYMRESRRFVLINCWHWSSYESAAMWRLHSRERDGIAIRTNFESLKESFICDADIRIGKVGYVDYDSTCIEEDNLYGPYLSKRRSVEHENEVRAITNDFPFPGQEDIYTVGNYYEVDLSLLIKEVIVAPYADDWFIDLIKSVTARYGLQVPVSKSRLADEPTWGGS